MQFEGIYTPVITPFHNDGSIDEEGFAKVIEFLIDAGTHGIVVAGT
ncbi:MAG: dihydrodipicolinate synthase family protein, partial [Proteobacteria bacterium]|nr:dihydrodipicolinate synthase family protein [Pseudomonadota bacterium]